MHRSVLAIERDTLKERERSNRLQLEDRAAHDWYRFVLSFPPHLVREYLQRFRIKTTQRVLDPFCGTGTTLVECKKLGIPSVGIEPNPMACFASKVKVDWDLDPHALLRHARDIARITSEKLEAEGYGDNQDSPLFGKRPVPGAQMKSLPPERLKLLLKNSISPLPLHKTLAVLDTLGKRANMRVDHHERLALARAIVSGISNLHFGPEVGVGPPKQDAPAVSIWLENVRAIADDLCVLRGMPDTEAIVHCDDARDATGILPENSIDAVITSPPYPNEKDYTRTTRLESVLLGFIASRHDLRSLKQGLVRSNTRGVYKNDQDDRFVEDHPEIQRIANAIEARRIALGKTSGFERLYSRVTKLYFGGMVRHLSALRKALRPGAQLAYVVGDQASYLRVMIRTGQILADLAESLGYQVINIDLFRTRLATATRDQLREEVVILRWPGTRATSRKRR